MTTQTETMQNSFWWGLLPLLAGVFVVLAAANVIPTDDENYNAPRWVAAAAGMAFVCAGVVVCLADGRFAVFQQRWWYGALGMAAGAGLFICFALPFNWVAFGPGEREFSGGISIPFVSIEFGRANELLGRAFFGLAALLLDAGLLLGLGSAAWEWLREQWRLLGEDVDALLE
jgi:hypothetical protein